MRLSVRAKTFASLFIYFLILLKFYARNLFVVKKVFCGTQYGERDGLEIKFQKYRVSRVFNVKSFFSKGVL